MGSNQNRCNHNDELGFFLTKRASAVFTYLQAGSTNSEAISEAEQGLCALRRATMTMAENPKRDEIS